MSEVTRYGMIGCGMMGQEHLKNIALLPNTAVTAIYEPDAGMRDIAAGLAPDAAFCDSIDQLLSRDGDRIAKPYAFVPIGTNLCFAAPSNFG